MARCSDCGLVGARDFLSRSLLEVDAGFRRNGDRGRGPTGKVIYFDSPICAAMAFNLAAESEYTDADSTLEVLNRDRDCAAFMPWQQGFAPKEHLEMKMLSEQREWQRTESNAQREWQLEQERKADERHKENLSVVVSATQQTLRVTLLAALLGAAAAFGAVWLAKAIQ